MEPWAEFERVMGGVKMRRPNVSKRFDETVAEATRLWCRCSGGARLLLWSCDPDWRALLELTRATAAFGSCYMVNDISRDA